MSRNVKEVSAKSYIATYAYNDNFHTYSVTTGPSPQFKKTGVLTTVSGATAANCPAGNVLRENGKKLFPDAYPGVSTYMVGVFDTLNNLSGFINPNDPVFAPFNGDRPNYLKDSVNSVNLLTKNLGAPVLTQGSVLCSGEVVSSGQVRSQDVTTLVTVDGAGANPNTAELDVSTGQVFKLVTTKNVTISPMNLSPGAHVYLVINGGGSHVVSFGLIKSVGPLSVVSGGLYTIHFICDGLALMELGRTAALS